MECSVSGPFTNTRMLLLAGSWTAPLATCTHRMDAGQLEWRPVEPQQPQALAPAVSAAACLMGVCQRRLIVIKCQGIRWERHRG